MKTFCEWLNAVFSPTPEDRSFLVNSKEKDKIFWIVKSYNWEDIHRDPSWVAIRIGDGSAILDLLGEKKVLPFSLQDSRIMKILRSSRPDLGNRDPDTRTYPTYLAAMADLGVDSSVSKV